MNIKNNILETIGFTPLVKINNLTEGNIFAKVESFNPGGSIKDRPALNMIIEAEMNGLIDKDTVIVEPTSGNMGVGLALACAVKGYKLIITMPETMSIERQKLIKSYGAEIILTDGGKGMQGAVDKALELAKSYEKSFIPQQFENPANPAIHESTTAREIWEDADGKIDVFIAGVGTGGTVSGCGRYLKNKNPNIQIVAVEPENSQMLAKGFSGSHKIQGIGANFIPQILEKSVIDSFVSVSDDYAYNTAKLLAQKEGILCGISSGAAMHAAIKIANEDKNKNIVVILPDTGERYLSVF